jgi:hypothetical protein
MTTTHHHPVQFEQGQDNEIIVNVPNVRIKLSPNTKRYNWDIAVAGDSLEEVLPLVKAADDWLRENYGTTD